MSWEGSIVAFFAGYISRRNEEGNDTKTNLVCHLRGEEVHIHCYVKGTGPSMVHLLSRLASSSFIMPKGVCFEGPKDFISNKMEHCKYNAYGGART